MRGISGPPGVFAVVNIATFPSSRYNKISTKCSAVPLLRGVFWRPRPKQFPRAAQKTNQLPEKVHNFKGTSLENLWPEIYSFYLEVMELIFFSK